MSLAVLLKFVRGHLSNFNPSHNSFPFGLRSVARQHKNISLVRNVDIREQGIYK